MTDRTADPAAHPTVSPTVDRTVSPAADRATQLAADPTTGRPARGRGVRRARPGARLLAGVVAGLLALLASGCSALGQPGAAAVVDGRAIDEEYLHTVVAELREYLDEGQVTPQLVLYLAAISEPVSSVAAERGLTISPEQAEEAWLGARERLDGQPADELAEPTTEILAVIEMYDLLVQDDQATAQLAEQIAALDIEVNPRYGAVDESTEVRPVVPTTPDWLRPGG